MHSKQFSVCTQPLQDWHLVIIVVGLCSLSIILLTFEAIFGDYRAVLAKDRERTQSRNVYHA